MTTPTGEPYGHALRDKYWSFAPGWTNLNSGGYGAPPKPVVAAVRALQDEVGGAPDLFMKATYLPRLHKLRGRLAEWVECEKEDIVLVQNATTGVNTVLRGLEGIWKEGDRLAYIETSVYNACQRSVQHVVDAHPHLNLSLLPIHVTYPISHAALVATVRTAIEEAENDGTGRKVRLGLFDAISSLPGVVVPWPDLVKVCKELDVFSLIDAAHELGQVAVSLRTSKPDAWVSNVHKWGSAHRAVAVLYVDPKWQHHIHSFPTGASYTVRTADSSPNWTSEFDWHSTVDWSPILAVDAAIDFRRDVLAGEERIYEYCHKLAVEGGEAVAKALGTKTMRNATLEAGELVGAMVNVLLPLPAPSSLSVAALSALPAYWVGEIMSAHSVHLPLFVHDDKYWVRISAQVYNEKSDFEFAGKVLGEMCEKVKREEWKQ